MNADGAHGAPSVVEARMGGTPVSPKETIVSGMGQAQQMVCNPCAKFKRFLLCPGQSAFGE